jgi:serine/threonine protein kinase
MLAAFAAFSVAKRYRGPHPAPHSAQGPPGVIRFHGICLDAFPNLFLVTEIAAGGSLEALLAARRPPAGSAFDADAAPARPLPLPRAARVAAGIAAAMAHVHSKGLAHRDLKPANVLLTRHADGVKLIDFGLARRFAAGSADPTDPGPSASEPAAAASDGAGTPEYQPPEALLRRPGAGGPAGDVYAFGIILWELRSAGRAPFHDLSLDAMAAAVIAGARPAPADPEWARACGGLEEQCWHPDPANRPPFSQASLTPPRSIFCYSLCYSRSLLPIPHSLLSSPDFLPLASIPATPFR